MYEEDARRMLVNRLKSVYMMGHGDGLSGGSKKGKARKSNRFLDCVPQLKSAHPGLKVSELARYYNPDPDANCELGEYQMVQARPKRVNKTNRVCKEFKQVRGRKRCAKYGKSGGVLVDNYYGNGMSGGKRGRRKPGRPKGSGLKKRGRPAKKMVGGKKPLRKRLRKAYKKKGKRGGVLVGEHGAGASGGKVRRKRARNNPWINEVREYADAHGVSFKDAMMALGRR